MEEFMAAGFEGEKLAELNLCLQDLCVTCWSDVSTGDGKAISANAWKCKKNWTIDCYLCPPQTGPHQKSRENWLADLMPTYKLSITLAISSNLKLVTCMEDDHPTVWVLSKSQDRVLKISPQVWKSLQTLLRWQVSSIHRIFKKYIGIFLLSNPLGKKSNSGWINQPKRHQMYRSRAPSK